MDWVTFLYCRYQGIRQGDKSCWFSLQHITVEPILVPLYQPAMLGLSWLVSRFGGLVSVDFFFIKLCSPLCGASSVLGSPGGPSVGRPQNAVTHPLSLWLDYSKKFQISLNYFLFLNNKLFKQKMLPSFEKAKQRFLK